MKKENLRDTTPAMGTKLFLDGEGASIKGFLDFCKQNTPLVISVTLAVLFVYGIVLFSLPAAGDNILYLDSPAFYIFGLIQVGRWITPLLVKLFFIKESGIFASNFISMSLIWLFSLLFCYFIAVFTKNTKRHNSFIPLALTVLTYSVWSQYFLFFYQNKIQTAFTCLNLISVYLLFDCLLTRKKIKVIIPFILTVFSFGVYQPLVPLFLCIVFIYFILLHENSNYPQREYSLLCLKLFVFFIAAFASMSIINKIIQSALSLDTVGMERVMIWNKSGLRSIIANILAQGYALTIGGLPFVHSIFSPVMADLYGSPLDPFGRPVADIIFNNARAIGNIILLPFAVVFLAMIFMNARNNIPKGRRLLYALAGVGVPVSIFFLVIVSGEVLGTRILFSLPFAAAFMFYYVARAQKTLLRRVCYVLILGAAFYQAQMSQIMLESTVRVSDIDSKIAFDLNSRIQNVLGGDAELPEMPVAYIGNINHPLKNQRFTIEMAGRSVFEWWTPSDMFTQTQFHVISFMNIFGFNYSLPTPDQMREAYEASGGMPAYPLEGCVKNLGYVVVVKMGD
jgi:hypothetical protein